MNRIRFLFLVTALTQVISSYANMASPIFKGTVSGSVITSSKIDILSEDITMIIDSGFRTSDYIIEYKIKADSSGVLPLAFIALDYKNKFEVIVDGKSIEILNCKTCFQLDLPFDALSEDGEAYFYVRWSENQGTRVSHNELKYFTVPLTKGHHSIMVKYTANAWTDVSDWTKEHSFRYSLSPAETWRSFGNLNINIISDKDINCNLGNPQEKEGNKNVWQFSSLPGKSLIISYQSKPNSLAKSLINLSPNGLGLIFSLLMLSLHSLWLGISMQKGRRINYKIEVGGLSVLLIIVDYIFFLFIHPMIDSLIGPEAGGYHGYTFLMIIFTPIILLIHWIVAHLLYLIMERKLKQEKK